MDRKTEMLKINADQKAYYEVANGSSTSKTNSFATNLWRTIRARALSVVTRDKNAAIAKRHRDWIGDIKGKKVLELGCGTGSPLTAHLVQSAKTYHALDLSQKNIDAVKKKHGNAANIGLFVADFLAEEFSETNYDVIYARAVLHHFRHVDVVLDRLEEKLAPGGRIVTFDPLQTWLPIRVIRAIYRPFQTDADWEYPFDRAVIQKIENRFVVLDRLAVYGKTKWAMALAVFFPALGQRLGNRWFDQDMQRQASDTDIKSYLQINYHLQRK